MMEWHVILCTYVVRTRNTIINKFKASDNAQGTIYLIKYTYRFALGPLQFGKYSGNVSTACLEISCFPRKECGNI